MSPPPRWVRVARSADLTGAGPFTAWGERAPLVVLRTASGLKAFEGRCPHRGALLGEGEIEQETLVCRNHRWRFAVETGRRVGGPECLTPCPLRERAGDVEVDVSTLAQDATHANKVRAVSELNGPPGLPLLGSAHLLDSERIHLQLEEWAQKYGTPFTYRFGSIQVLVVAEAEDMNRVFRERPDAFRRVSSVEGICRELGAAGVFSAEGEAWKPQRRLSMEALHPRHLRGFYPTLAVLAERLRGRWSRAATLRETLDLPEELKRFTVDITTLLVFGYDINTLEEDTNVIQDKLALLFPVFARRLTSVIPWWRIFRLPRDRKVDRAVKELWHWLAGLVSQTRRDLEANPERGERPRNFLEAMVAARDDTGKPFDDETIFGNAMTMLLAGEDTTAYSLAWAEHRLLDARAEVDALHAEIDSVLGSSLIPKDFDVANRLTYAGAVANEAMRLHPIAPVFFFEACRDTTVGNIEVPGGTHVLLLTRSPATDPKHFAEPLEFRPSRWISTHGGPHEPGGAPAFRIGPSRLPRSFARPAGDEGRARDASQKLLARARRFVRRRARDLQHRDETERATRTADAAELLERRPSTRDRLLRRSSLSP